MRNKQTINLRKTTIGLNKNFVRLPVITYDFAQTTQPYTPRQRRNKLKLKHVCQRTAEKIFYL